MAVNRREHESYNCKRERERQTQEERDGEKKKKKEKEERGNEVIRQHSTATPKGGVAWAPRPKEPSFAQVAGRNFPREITDVVNGAQQKAPIHTPAFHLPVLSGRQCLSNSIVPLRSNGGGLFYIRLHENILKITQEQTSQCKRNRIILLHQLCDCHLFF